MISSTGDADYDVILARVAEIREEQGLTNPTPPPHMPTNFSMEFAGMRLSISFEPIERNTLAF